MIYFQKSFTCHGLELLRTAPLPIHKVIITTIFYDGMNAVYFYFENKHLSSLVIFVYLSSFRLFIVASGCPSERRPRKMVSCYGG